MENNKDQKSEGTQSVLTDYFTIDTPDDSLVLMIDKKISSARLENKKREEEGNRNERYWGADQLQGIPLRWHNSRIVQNRIYIGLETMIPIMTAEPPEPVVSAGNDKPESKKLAKEIQATIYDKYDTDNQQMLFQMASRHWALDKIGVLKIRWVEEIDDYVVEAVHPNKIIFGTDGYLNEDVWVAHYLENTLQELIDMFPEAEDKLRAEFGGGGDLTSAVLGTTVGYWEYWSEDGSFVVSKVQNIVLQKKLNPYLFWNNKKEFDRKKNHFRFPHKPFIFINSQNLGRYIWDATTPVSQCIPVQDGINLLHRIITDTAADQGILIGAQDYIAIEELSKYTGGPMQKLSVKGDDATRALYRLPAKELKQYLLEMLIHLEAAADNIMGTHSTTRGEKSKNPTLGQDLMAKESDFGRIDGFVRSIEKAADELFNWEVQMMKVKYTKDHYVSMLGESDAATMIKFNKSKIEDGIKITVKQGSTLPTDKLTQRQEAIDLARLNKIDPISFFERMDYPNPRETAKRLVMYDKDPMLLFPELVDEIDKINKKTAKKMGRTDEKGNIVPPNNVEQVESGAEVPPPVVPNETMPTPPAPTVPTPPETPQETEHTARLLSGEQVPPFDGIVPSIDHVEAELSVMGAPEFPNLDRKVQAIYAKHTLQEKEIIEQKGQ